jgi:heme-degrading monooxygenase HmoA
MKVENMVILTIVEGRIPVLRTREFEETFAALKKEAMPPGLITSSLLKNVKARETYHIQTTWESLETLEKMRSSTQTPKAIELFQKMGVTPTLEVYEVVDSVS